MSKLVIGFVNLRPIVPGHVLVSSRRVVERVRDLSDEEFGEMMKTARDVGDVLEEHHGASGFNLAIQDGKAAGQSVPHVSFRMMK